MKHFKLWKNKTPTDKEFFCWFLLVHFRGQIRQEQRMINYLIGKSKQFRVNTHCKCNIFFKYLFWWRCWIISYSFNHEHSWRVSRFASKSLAIFKYLMHMKRILQNFFCFWRSSSWTIRLNRWIECFGKYFKTHYRSFFLRGQAFIINECKIHLGHCKTMNFQHLRT